MQSPLKAGIWLSKYIKHPSLSSRIEISMSLGNTAFAGATVDGIPGKWFECGRRKKFGTLNVL
jgi:hypothetical protein